MKVTLIAQTELTMTGLSDDPWGVWGPAIHPIMSTDPVDEGEASDGDLLAEFAGRACYQSFHRPNPATARNEDYLKHILEVQHESVMVHGGAAFYVEGVSRALTHELVRHRFLGFSQLSQRYVDGGLFDFVVPPDYEGDHMKEARAILEETAAYLRHQYDRLGVLGREEGRLSRKRNRSAARAVMPNMAETKLVVSGNFRAWRDFLKQRDADGADEEIRRFAKEVRWHLIKIAPNQFQDL